LNPIARDNSLKGQAMSIIAFATISILPLAAIGYSILYLLFGGGLGGAVLIFIVAKMLGD
jgi:hypothetical protein